MAIKEVSFKFNPFETVGKAPPKNRQDKKEALAEIADAVQDYILEKVSKGSSPISKGAWKRTLSKEYKEFKKKEGGSSIADMELDGDMLDALEAKVVGDNVWIGIKGDQAPKADGHNNHSGKSKLPAREFIPKKGEKFKRDLLSDIKFIIDEFDDG